MNFYLMAMVKRFWTVLLMGLMLTTLASCGGGSSSSGSPLNGGGSGTSTNGTIKGALTDTSGNSASTIPSGSYLNATATVLNGSGAAVSGVVVTFAVSNTAGTISPTLGTAVTNSKGQAVVTLQPGTSTNAAGYISASTAISSTSSTISSGNVAFTNGASSSSSPTLALSFTSSPTSCTANTISSTCSIIASATLKDSNGNPVANNLVNFSSTGTLSSINPSVGTALTNSSGVATVIIVPLSLSVALSEAGAGGQVSASATYSGTTVIASQYFTVGTTSLTLATTAPSNGAASIAAYGSTTISVQVNSNGSVYTAQPVTVNFSSTCQNKVMASLPASATTSNGIATVTYRDIGCGATVDTVTATVSGSTSQSTAAITVAAPQATSIKFVSANPSSESIVLPGAGGTGRTSTAILTYQVIDTNGNAVPGVVVNFTNSTGTTVGKLQTTTQTSDASGNVVATVNSNSVGTFRITATLASNSAVSTISDSVVVSQGIPSGSSFTIAPEKLNINGLTTVMTDAVTVYLSDANGNPVPAGSPISATTDGGQIENSAGNSGGCTTDAYGKCSLVFTSTNPIPSSGIATVTVTTTDGSSNVISAKTYITLSSNGPNPTQLIDTGTKTTNGIEIVSASSTLKVTDCNLNPVIVLTDTNGNALAGGTTISGSSLQTGVSVGATIPATLSDVSADVDKTGATVYSDIFNISGTSNYVQGTQITVPLTITAGSGTSACLASGTNKATAEFSITVTTPNGGKQTAQNFTLTYPTL